MIGSPMDRTPIPERVTPNEVAVMRYACLVAALFALALPCRSQDLTTEAGFKQLLSQKLHAAGDLHQKGEYEQAIEVYDMLIALPGMCAYPSARASIYYNLACAHSLMGRKREALANLGLAVEAGFSDLELMVKDPDLENLHEEPRYEELVAVARAKGNFWTGPSLATDYSDTINVDGRAAGLARLWSEIKYNFAFFHQVPDLDWDSLFVAYLPRVMKTQSTLEYYRTLGEMCAHLKDGHTNVTPPRELWDSLWAKPPIRTRLIEDRVLIVDVFDESLEADGVVPGVEVLRIDGIPAGRYAEERVMPYQCASSPQGLTERTYNYSLLSGSVETRVKLTLENDAGQVYTRSLARTRRQQSRPTLETHMLEGDLAYVALNSFGAEEVVSQFDSVFGSIETAAGLVIDLRENQGGNSGFGYQILARLTAQPFTTTAWRTRQYSPTFRAWGMAPAWYRSTGSTYQPGGGEPYAGPVAVLIGAQTASAAEDFCVAFDTMDRGVMIGEPTYGSTGQPLVFGLPGGGFAQVCTKHDTYPDGREFVGIGVLPDILISPTADDVRSGRDPVLEAAVTHLRAETDE
jgi:C-terminal processing protease CtpA/Prc